MSEADILAEMRAIVRDMLKDPVEFSADTLIVEGLQLDSLQQMDFIVAVENRFKICLEESRIYSWILLRQSIPPRGISP